VVVLAVAIRATTMMSRREQIVSHRNGAMGGVCSWQNQQGGERFRQRDCKFGAHTTNREGAVLAP
jgi:hypothetical protein